MPVCFSHLSCLSHKPLLGAELNFPFSFESNSPLYLRRLREHIAAEKVMDWGRIRFTTTVLIAAKINNYILYINLTTMEHLPLGWDRSFPCHLQGHKWCGSVLGQVIVYLRVVLVSLQVFPVDKTFYPLLQISRLYRKLQLFATKNICFININIQQESFRTG